MKKVFAFLLAAALCSAAANAIPVSAAKQQVDESLWEKFLRYDLCITDYDALPEDEQTLCRFIFETEQSSKDTIRCERARRTLAHDPDIGERVALEQLADAYGIWDRYGSRKYGYSCYLHCVPDIVHLDYNEYNEYWLDDGGEKRIFFYHEQASPRFELHFDSMSDEEILWLEQFKYQQSNGYRYIDAKAFPGMDREKIDGEWYYISDAFLHDDDGNAYFVNPDGTAALVLSSYAHASYNMYDEATLPITEPVVIPAEVDGHPVTAIEERAFFHTPITNVILPETIEEINAGAFSGCLFLEQINFPDSLRYIGESAFQWTALTSLSIDDPDLRIAEYAFYLCTGLKEVTLNCASLGGGAFSNCPALESLTLLEGMEEITANAFSDCAALREVSLPSTLKYIGDGAFAIGSSEQSCVLASVTIPKTVEIIGVLPPQNGERGTSGMLGATHPLTDDPVGVFDTETVICGWYNTDAHRYAIENRLQFRALDEVELRGDCSDDGVISIADIVLMQRYLCGDSDIDLASADLNADGKINAVDYTLMKQLLVTG